MLGHSLSSGISSSGGGKLRRERHESKVKGIVDAGSVHGGMSVGREDACGFTVLCMYVCMYVCMYG